MKNNRKKRQVLPPQQTLYAPEYSNGEVAGNRHILAILADRWPVVLLTMVIVCALALPAIWIGTPAMQLSSGMIRIAPLMTEVLSGERDPGEISNYQIYMNTQADLIKSNRVLQQVADKLATEDLDFFKPSDDWRARIRSYMMVPDSVDMVERLRGAVAAGTIMVTADPRKEFIQIGMQSMNPEEAEAIVNAFISAYMDIEVAETAQGEGQTLALLESERDVIAERMQELREAIYRMGQEYGSVTLDGRQEMMMQRIAAIQQELTGLETRKLNLQARLKILEGTRERTLSPTETIRMKNEYVNADRRIAYLVDNLVRLEQELVADSQRMTANNPALVMKTHLVEAMNEKLGQRRLEVEAEFDEMVRREAGHAHADRIEEVKAELEQIDAHVQILRDTLASENQRTIEIGRKHLSIAELQEQLAMTRELHEVVRRRIQQLELERKRPARVTVFDRASTTAMADRRPKLSLAAVMGGFAMGMFFAVVRDRRDQRLKTPADLVKRVGVTVIGTTSNTRTARMARLPATLSEEYQTIRANLGLMTAEGMPRIVAVTSSGVAEGKTTCAINLATSLARGGKNILLVDGDLRKPDIARLMGLPRNSRGLRDVLEGCPLAEAVQRSPGVDKLDVLTADWHNGVDAFEILSARQVPSRVKSMSELYDHVIIDTPPILSAPDGLLWARIAQSVILVCFSGKTQQEDLKETLERLEKVNARILGTVMNSVETHNAYYRYGYSYGHGGNGRTRRRPQTMLLPVNKSSRNNSRKPKTGVRT